MSAAPDPRPLLALGLAVFPLPAGSKAAPPGWQRHQLRPGDGLDDWPAGANIGVGARANGLVILDLDRDRDDDRYYIGLESLIASSYNAGDTRTGPAPIPETLTVDTPRGGEHRYFRIPPGAVIGSTSGGSSGLGPGIDTRGPGRTRGGYVVGPGSIVDGRTYTIRDPAAPIAELPVWITAWLMDVAALRRERAAASR